MFRTATNGINLQTQLNFQEYLLIRELFTMKRKRTKNESKFAVLMVNRKSFFSFWLNHSLRKLCSNPKL